MAYSLKVAVDNIGLREKTTNALRDAIVNFHFKPGEKLVERRLCEETGVSRTCVREALRALEVEGLVDKLPNQGIRVHEVGVEEAQQIYEARAILESAMVERFIEQADAKQFTALEKAIKAVETTLSGNQQDYVQALDSVSNAIMKGAGNVVVHQMFSVLNARVTYLRAITSRLGTMEQKQQSCALLKAIFEAMRAHRTEQAVLQMKAYVQFSAENASTILRDLRSSPERLQV